MKWHETKVARLAETTSKIFACIALFSIVLPTALPNIFLACFLLFSIIAGNFKFKYQLITNNSIALISLALFFLFVIGLLYTSAPTEEAQSILQKYGKLFYIPILLCAFYQKKWKKIGYICFLSSVVLMMLLSYLTLSGWSPESIYSGTYAGRDEHIVFRSRIAHGILVAYATYLFIYHAINNIKYRYLFALLALLGSYNVLIMVASRTGQLIWIVLMLFIIYQNLGWKKAILGLIIVPSLAFLLLFSSELTRTRIVELYDDLIFIQQGNFANSLGLRVLWAQGGWHIFKQHPLIGSGTGSYSTEFEQFIQNTDIENKEQFITQNPHNGYISIGSQLGFVGLLMLGALFIQQWRLSKHLQFPYDQIAKGMIITMIVGNLVNSMIFSHTQGLFFAFMTALLYSTTPSRESSKM